MRPVEETFEVRIPPYLEFSMLALRRCPATGRLLYYNRVLIAFCRFNAIRTDVPDFLFAEIIAAWYAVHRLENGALCRLMEEHLAHPALLIEPALDSMSVH